MYIYFWLPKFKWYSFNFTPLNIFSIRDILLINSSLGGDILNRKILFTLSLLILAIFAIGSVSALDFGFLSGDSEQTVTIDGIDFKIPDGFTEDADEEVINESNVQSGITYLTNSKLFEKDDAIMVILVADYGEYKVTDDIAKEVGGDATTIEGVDGYLKEDGFFYVFDYAKNDKLVVLSTNDKDIIGDFIIA